MRKYSLSLTSRGLVILATFGLACSEAPPGGAGSGGSSSSGAAPAQGPVVTAGTGGAAGSGGSTQGGSESGGASNGQSGAAMGGNSQTGGDAQAGGTSGTGGQSNGGSASSCVPTKTWGTADPSLPGPFEVMVEKDVGPTAGVADALHDNMSPRFNIYRPKDLSQGYCHPVITWGNGTGDQPEPAPPACVAGACGHYKVLLDQLASHGFVVVASLSSQTAQGTPLPQVVGVDWMIEESNHPSSALYHHLDTAHIGATGHSQGGAATTLSGADARITTIAPICGSREDITLHGPALLLCGGADTTVPCSRVQPAYDSITTVPVMMAELAGVTHGSWIGSIKDPVMVGVTGWMRVHLMNDTANRSTFYGSGCGVCADSKWTVQRKMMDQ